MGKAVVLVGLHPDVVDYTKWLGMTPETLRAALEADRDGLNALGYDAALLYVTSAETADDTVREALGRKAYDCVLIGAGVRTNPDHFLLFEKLVNAVHAAAPGARICFNTNPRDTAEAVARWL